MNRPAKNELPERLKDKSDQSPTVSRSRVPLYLAIASVILIVMFVTASPLLTSSASSKATTGPASEFESLFVDGTITIKAGNYIGTTPSATTQTATFTKQIFNSVDCSTGGGSVDTVTGVDSITGHSFTLGSTSSVRITIPDSGIYFAHVSDQNGPFVNFQAADNSYSSSITYIGDGHQVCIQGFDGSGPRTYLAQFYAGIELFDSCGNERYSFRPGETITFKVTGGLTHNVFPLRLLSAGGSVNECTFLPSGPTPPDITSDPFIYNFTLPSSDAAIPSFCSSNNTTSILGNWRVVAFDPALGGNRNEVRFTLANDAPQPGCADGTITIKSGNYLGATTTETATITKQIFNSNDCSGTGGSINTVTGVDSTTGHSFTLGAGSSVKLSIPDSGPGPVFFSHLSEQNGLFVAFQAADNSYFNSVIYSGDGHQVCVQGFNGSETRTYRAQFYPGIQLFDECDNERDSFRPGETIKFKVSGGLKPNPAFPMRLLSAGGSVNECTFLPIGSTPPDITSDPFIYNFTLPSSDAEIPSFCSSNNTTSILGNWRVVAFDAQLGGNRAETRFTLANDAPQTGCADGTVTIKSGNYLGATTTETARFTKQIFNSNDCSGTGGSIDTVTGVDSTTGHSFTLGAGRSVQLTIPDSGPGPVFFSHLSEQNGLFVAFQAADISYFNSVIYSGDGHQVCVQGFSGSETRTYRAQFYPGIQLFDACDNERDSFRPGETIKFKVSGGLTPSALPLKLLAAGGSVNECTFLPLGSDPLLPITTDPFIYNFTLPASDAEIPSYCSASPTTSILGNWRVVTLDQSIGGNRAETRWTVANDAPQFGCAMTCPGDITVANDTGTCGAVVNYTPPTVGPSTATCDHPPGSTFPAGTTLVTCTSPPGLSCSFNVTVNDTHNPTITAPAGFSVNTNSGSCVATGVALGTPTTGDNCQVSSVTNNAPAQFPIGPTTVTWTVTDNHGNSATADQVITVVDNAPPSLTVPANSSAPANASCQAAIPNVVSGSSASDNCGAATISQNPTAGTLVGTGPHTITVTATDPAGNHTDKLVTFTVIDTTPPTITAPANASYQCPSQVPAANPNQATASDNCSTPTVTVTQTSNGGIGSTVSPLVITRTFTARDAVNNSASAVQTITVIDNTPPTISCPADIIADFNPAVNGAVVTYTAPVGTDNCAGATTQRTGLASGSTFPLGTSTVTHTVTNAVGLTASCSFKVTVALTSLVGLDSATISGSGYADSYSSTGGYPATKTSLANILSNGTITIGNSGKVWGNVRSTRAGVTMSGASSVTGNATAGTTVSLSGGATVGGIKTNNALAPTMTLPSVAACSPFSSTSGITGTYTYNAGTGDLTLSGANIATLANGNYCFHNITMGNSAQLKVNGPVVIKMTGTLNASGASNLNNTTQIPSNLRILSSYSGTNGVVIGNSASVYALIYAPNTGLSLSGTAPVLGTFAGKTLTIGNGGAIHYDTQLKSAWPAVWALLP